MTSGRNERCSLARAGCRGALLRRSGTALSAVLLLAGLLTLLPLRQAADAVAAPTTVAEPCGTSVSGDVTHRNSDKPDDAEAFATATNSPATNDDLCSTTIDSTIAGGAINLVVGWKSFGCSSGNGNVDFHLAQSAATYAGGSASWLTPSNGDLWVEVQRSGTSITAVNVRSWTGTSWGAPVAANPSSASFDGPTCTGTVNFNLSATGLIVGCRSFIAEATHTQSSNSFSSSLQDFQNPFPISIASCAIDIAKSANPSAAPVGATVTYTLVVTNPGTLPLSAVTVTDPRCDTPPTVLGKGTDSSPTTLDPGDVWTYTCTHVIGAADPDPLPNTATASGTNGQTTLTDTAHASVDILKPNLTATKSVSPDGPVAPGQNLTYTVTVKNIGDAAKGAFQITDVVPSNTSFISCTASCTNAAGLLSWNVAGLAADNGAPGGPDETSVSFTVAVLSAPAPANGTLINNTATVDGKPTNGTENPVQYPVLAAAKTADPPSGTVVAPGASITYTITVQNTGLVAGTVEISDTVPANTTFVSCTASCTGTATLIWPNVAVPASGSASVSFTVVVAAGTPDNSVIDNQATWNDGTPHLTNHVTHPVRFPILTHSKAVDVAGPVTQGQQLTYTIVVTNVGHAAKGPFLVSDAVPAGTTFTGTCGGAVCSFAGDTVTWNVPSLGANDDDLVAPENDVITLTFTVTVNADFVAPGEVVNTAVVDGANTNTVRNPLAEPNLVAQKQNAPTGSVQPGATIVYSIQITNTGTGAKGPFTVADTVPAGTTFVAGSCAPACTVGAGGGAISWALPGLGANDANTTAPENDVTTVSFSVTVNTNPRPANGSNISNIATVDAKPTNTVTNNIVYPVLGGAKQVSPTGDVKPGEQLNYSVTVTNTGLADAVAVPVTDTVPANTMFLSCTNGCTTSGSPVTQVGWQVGVPAGGSVTVSFVVAVNAAPAPANGTVIRNTAVVVEERTNEVTNTVKYPVLAVQKTVQPTGSVKPGETLTYTVSVINSGQAGATGVAVSDDIPDHTTFVAGSCAPACVATGSPVSSVAWTVDIAAGGTVSLTFAVVLDSAPAPANGTVVANTALMGDVESNEVTNTVAYAVLGIAKAANPVEPVDAGSPIGFTITVDNTGTAPATDAQMTDVLPTGAGLVWTLGVVPTGWSCTAGSPAAAVVAGATVTGTLRCVNPSFAVGSATFSLSSPTTGVTPSPVSNTATIAATDAESPPPASASVIVRRPGLNLTKTATPVGPVDAGSPIGFTIRTSNAGPGVATNVVVTDDLPTGTGLVWTLGAVPGGVSCKAGSPQVAVPATGGTVTGTLTCTVTSLAVDASVTLTLTSPTAVSGTVTNTARATVANGTNPPDSTANVNVQGPAVRVTKVAAQASVTLGSPIGFTVTVRNDGPGIATGVVLSRPPPRRCRTYLDRWCALRFGQPVAGMWNHCRCPDVWRCRVHARRELLVQRYGHLSDEWPCLDGAAGHERGKRDGRQRSRRVGVGDGRGDRPDLAHPYHRTAPISPPNRGVTCDRDHVPSPDREQLGNAARHRSGLEADHDRGCGTDRSWSGAVRRQPQAPQLSPAVTTPSGGRRPQGRVSWPEDGEPDCGGIDDRRPSTQGRVRPRRQVPRGRGLVLLHRRAGAGAGPARPDARGPPQRAAHRQLHLRLPGVTARRASTARSSPIGS